MGKTTCSAARAVDEAGRGTHVLVVSTDPAHSLGDALGARLGPRPRRVAVGKGVLRAAELDADGALERWLAERRELLATITLRGTYLDREDVDRFLGLSLPGVDELIGLIELLRLARAVPGGEVVVDTAPTGHTLRLLEMPATLGQIARVLDDMQAKHRFLSHSLGGSYREDAADTLVREIEGEARMLAERLRDPARTSFSWIVLPEWLALEEAKDAVHALDRLGIRVGEVIVNRLTPRPSGPCALCQARRREEADVLAAIEAAFPGRTLRRVETDDAEPRGVVALRRLAARLRRTVRATRSARPRAIRRPKGRTPRRRAAAAPPWWLDGVAPKGVRLILFGGKGGVGKTSSAASAALALAASRPGGVLLLSVDPAHSLADVLEVPLGDHEQGLPGTSGRLHVRELDAERALTAARERYASAVDELFDALRGGSHLDPAYDRAVVQDLIDLAPPGIDELFALVAVTDALVTRRDQRAVVLDTAPTGHALRLLALPASAREWVQALLAVLLKYRSVIRLGRLAEELVGIARQLRELEALLRDPERTSFVVLTRAAELPRKETERLLDDLGVLGVPPGALIVNALTPPGCARCRRAARAEAREVERLARSWRTLTPSGRPMILAPLVAPPPRGVAALEAWARGWRLPDARTGSSA